MWAQELPMFSENQQQNNDFKFWGFTSKHLSAITEKIEKREKGGRGEKTNSCESSKFSGFF